MNQHIESAVLPTTNGHRSKKKRAREPGISVIVPIYNEEENVLALHTRVKETLEQLGEPWELILVDDGSRDSSAEIMESISETDPHVIVVELRRNFGQTAALAAGFDYARGPVVIPMDADLQNDPADIPALLAKLDEGYDIVSGWRKARKDPLISKTIPSLFWNKLASALTGLHLHDYGCTLKAYRREVLEQVNLYGEFHRFIPALASSTGARVAEVEVSHHPRRFGKSKYGFTRMFRGILDLLTLKLLLSYHTRPMQLFGGLGLLTLGLGGLCMLATVIMRILMDFNMTGNPLLYMAILATISGIQFVGLGFLGEVNMRTYYESQRKRTYVVQEIVTCNSVQRS